MLKFILTLLVLVHGCFALAVQTYSPTSWLVGALAKKKLDAVHAVFPSSIYPAQPPGPGGYFFAFVQVLGSFLLLKRMCRL